MEKTLDGFTFFSTFDSGNLDHVEIADNDAHPLRGLPELKEEAALPPEKGGPLGVADYSFRIWTRPDCAGTEFENGNRTWFYFGVKMVAQQVAAGCSTDSGESSTSSSPRSSIGMDGLVESYPMVRFTVMNLNKQSKLFSQGMAPITMVVPLAHTVHSYGKDKVALKQAYPQTWERIKDKPTFWTVPSLPTTNSDEKESKNKDNKEKENASQFIMSFRIRCDPKATTFVAFTYPYTYRELQLNLGRLERRFGNDKSFEEEETYDEKFTPSRIYFHREMACRSVKGHRVELLTVTDSNGMLTSREPVLENLFPESGHVPRARSFAIGKKVVFVSARVHPGETQSSFVMNGLIKFLLRETDPRAIVLRRRYVFKLMPMLNPDGVVNGHYRTDTRGINLNRVYGSPSFDLHPPIYAARKLILYAHHGYEVFEDETNLTVDNGSTIESEANSNSTTTTNRTRERLISELAEIASPGPDLPTIEFRAMPSSSSSSANSSSHWLRSSLVADPSAASATSLLPSIAASASSVPTSTPIKNTSMSSVSNTWYEMTETSRFSEGDESIADFSTVFNNSNDNNKSKTPAAKSLTSFTGAFKSSRPSTSAASTSSASTLPSLASTSSASSTKGILRKDSLFKNDDSNSSLIEEDANLDFPTRPPEVATLKILEKPLKLSQEKTKSSFTPAKNSGLFLYVDIHGHASKRGIFMYGNHFTDMEHQLACMLLPKVMSINCAHFDFPACVFTEKNMYMKDRHTGAGREGSGRVSAFKATGLLQSYTLECNFNTGRLVNGIPTASRDSGRATPPPKLDHPPKYDPEIYECSGKALGIAILDMTESNPWTRLTCSAYKNLRGVRDWLRKYIKTQAEEQEKEKNAAGNNKIKSAASPSRSLRSATSRRVRTFSASSSSASKKLKAASLKAIPTSPESYRPVSKIARKNSGHQQQSSNHSPRAVKRATSSPGFSRSSLIGRPTTANKDKEGKESKRKSSSKALARARSLSTANIVLNAVTNEIFAGPSKSTRSTSRPSSPTSSSVKKRSTRSRPGSPKQSSAARRPISPGHFGGIAKVVSVVKTPKKLRKNKNKIVPKSTAATELLVPPEAVILTASTPTSAKKSKSPIKRIRRRKGGQNPSSTSGTS